MSRSEDFLAQIRAAPTDDAIRLVYGDYLLERADPRGELIHLQHTRPEDPLCEKLSRQLSGRWHPLRVTYRRGFVDSVAGPPKTLAAHREVFAQELVREVRIEPANDMRPLFDIPELADVERVIVLPGDEHVWFGNHAAHQLAECPHFRDLRTFELTSNAVMGQGMRALATAAWADRLHTLVVNSNPIADGQAVAKVRLEHLRVLELGNCGIQKRLDMLASAAPNLETLRLPQNTITGSRAGNIGPFPWLVELVLDHNPLRASGLSAIGELACPRLRRLSLVSCWLDNDALRSFVARPLARSITDLDLSNNPISINGLRTLVANMPALEALRIHPLPGESTDDVRAIFAHRNIALTVT